MTTHHPRIAAAALIITGLLVAACSSSSSGSPTHPATKGTHSDGRTARSSGATNAAAAPLTTSSTTQTSAAAHPVARGSACTLITEKDVTAKMAADPGKGSADERPGASQCIYGNYRTQVVLVNVVRSQGTADYHHARTDPKLTRAPGTGVVDVSGLGDQAFELSAPHTDALYFTKGDALIIVAFSTQTAPATGAALALAKIAAGRL